MQFNYQNPFGWTVSAAFVPLDNDVGANIGFTNTLPDATVCPNQSNLLRFYVDNSVAATPRQDVVYNDIAYQLEFIEMYVPGLHKFNVPPPDTSAESPTPTTSASSPSVAGNDYHLEVVLYHSTGAPTPSATTPSATTASTTSNPIPKQWLAVSVFAVSRSSFSLSQSFFYDLIATVYPVLNKTCDAPFENIEHTLTDITWKVPVTGGGKTPSATPVASSKDAGVNGSPAIPITPRSYWSPYQLLPAQKSFYVYEGEFPYAPCFYTSVKSTPPPVVTWVVLDHPTTINLSDYNNLQKIINYGAYLNTGSLYTALPLTSEGATAALYIAYNNGKLVDGNSENDKFYVKCMKKSPVVAGPAASGIIIENQQDALDQTAELAQLAGGTTVPPPNTISTYYTPPSSPMSTLVFCFVFALLFFAMFAASNWITEHNEDGGGSTSRHIQQWMVALLCIALFVMYGMSFFTAALGVGIMPLIMALMIGILLIVVKLVRKIFITSSDSGDANGLWNWVKDHVMEIIGYSILFACAVIIGLVIFWPLHTIGSQINQTYTFYYTNGSSLQKEYYIGRRANVTVEFSGFTMDYNNNYTVGQSGYTSNKNPASWSTGGIGAGQTTSGGTGEGGTEGIPTDSFMLIPPSLINPSPSPASSSATAIWSENTMNKMVSTAETNAGVTQPPTPFKVPLPTNLFPSPSHYAYTQIGDASQTTILPNSQYTPDTISTVGNSQYESSYNEQFQKNQDALGQILETYNTLMQASSIDPLTNFIQAYIQYAQQSTLPWFNLVWQSNITRLTSDNIEQIMVNSTTLAPLYLYLKGLQYSDLPQQQLDLPVPATPT